MESCLDNEELSIDDIKIVQVTSSSKIFSPETISSIEDLFIKMTELFLKQSKQWLWNFSQLLKSEIVSVDDFEKKLSGISYYLVVSWYISRGLKDEIPLKNGFIDKTDLDPKLRRSWGLQIKRLKFHLKLTEEDEGSPETEGKKDDGSEEAEMDDNEDNEPDNAAKSTNSSANKKQVISNNNMGNFIAGEDEDEDDVVPSDRPFYLYMIWIRLYPEDDDEDDLVLKRTVVKVNNNKSVMSIINIIYYHF
jgi:hypothetical protein